MRKKQLDLFDELTEDGQEVYLLEAQQLIDGADDGAEADDDAVCAACGQDPVEHMSWCPLDNGAGA